MKKMLLLVVALLVIFTLPTASLAEDDADFLFEDYEEFVEPDIDDGPWVYHSENLTVCIRKSTEGKKLCYIADIFIRNNEKAFTGWAYMDPPGLPEELPHVIARRYDAVFGLVGDYLCHRKNDKGANIRDGKVYFDDDDADVLAILPNGDMDIYPKGTITADELIALGVEDTLAFGPIILQDGELTKAVTTHRLKPGNVRTGIGKVEDGHYIAIVTRHKYTFPQYAELFKSYGCQWAYNLDGGQSSAMIIMGEQVNAHTLENIYGDVICRQRPLPDVFLLGRSELVPDVDDPEYYKGSR